MEEKKNNTGLVWLIIILITLVLGFVGYIVYNKIIVNDTKNMNNTPTTTLNNENNNKEKISLYNYPKKNDDIVKVYGDLLNLSKKNLSSEDFKKIENGENFENITFSINNNNNFVLSCNEYNTEYKYCMEKSVKIDNRIELYYEDFADYGGFYILITDKYYIVQFSNGLTQYGSVYVYDKNGNELIKTDSTTIYTLNSGVAKYTTIFENRLYFIKHVNCMNTLSYIDLNDSNLNIIELDTESTEGANEC